jgi:hypothetical protein
VQFERRSGSNTYLNRCGSDAGCNSAVILCLLEHRRFARRKQRAIIVIGYGAS